MSLVAYGPFTDKMKISAMGIPGSVTQPPFVAGNATNVSKDMPHTCTLLHTNLPWGLDSMSLSSGGLSINVWDGESFDWNFDLD